MPHGMTRNCSGIRRMEYPRMQNLPQRLNFVLAELATCMQRPLPQSCRSATTGSTLAARRAGR